MYYNMINKSSLLQRLEGRLEKYLPYLFATAVMFIVNQYNTDLAKVILQQSFIHIPYYILIIIMMYKVGVISIGNNNEVLNRLMKQKTLKNRLVRYEGQLTNNIIVVILLCWMLVFLTPHVQKNSDCYNLLIILNMFYYYFFFVIIGRFARFAYCINLLYKIRFQQT